VAERPIELVVRTPREVVAELGALSLRVPSRSGQVGLRPRCEPFLLDVEPGLALVRTAEGLRFLATAGGLLRCDGRRAILLTPVAVAGSDARTVQAQLADALATPRADFELRRAVERLETGILLTLRSREGSRVREVLP
jgi:F0F1-type ATP synthase epsilon subunit